MYIYIYLYISHIYMCVCVKHRSFASIITLDNIDVRLTLPVSGRLNHNCCGLCFHYWTLQILTYVHMSKCTLHTCRERCKKLIVTAGATFSWNVHVMERLRRYSFGRNINMYLHCISLPTLKWQRELESFIMVCWSPVDASSHSTISHYIGLTMWDKSVLAR